MNFPISISTWGYLILFGKKTKINFKDTIWERIIIKILDWKYDLVYCKHGMRKRECPYKEVK